MHYLNLHAGRVTQRAPPQVGPVVHRYSGEVLLRPKTCRVAVADTAAENLRRIAWHSRGVAMELSVPWLVQEEHALFTARICAVAVAASATALGRGRGAAPGTTARL